MKVLTFIPMIFLTGCMPRYVPSYGLLPATVIGILAAGLTILTYQHIRKEINEH